MNTPPDGQGFRSFQQQFARRLRDPAAAPLPDGVPPRRMAVYEELLFNNLESFLGSAFPISRRILGSDEWQPLVRRYFRDHCCESPLFRDIPGEFLAWFEPLAEDAFPQRPYLWEFMHYEWLELAVSIAPGEVDISRTDPAGDLLDGRPALHPTAQLACYRYPVHHIGPENLPQEETGPYCYLLHRDDDDTVRFTQLNPLTLQLLQRLDEQRETGRAALTALAAQLQHPDPERFTTQGVEMVAELRRQGIIIGTWRNQP